MGRSRVVLASIVALTIAILPNTAAAAAPNRAALVSAARQSLLDEYAVLEGRGTPTLVPGTDEFGSVRSSAERLAAAVSRRDFNATYGLKFISADVALEVLAVSSTDRHDSDIASS